jgi:hypothetical protein
VNPVLQCCLKPVDRPLCQRVMQTAGLRQPQVPRKGMPALHQLIPRSLETGKN